MANPATGTTPQATESPEGTEARTSAAALQARLVRRKLVENSITVIVFLGLFAVFGLWLGDRFLNADARLLDVHQSVPILLLGLAVLVTLVPGMFDLSVAGVATLSCFLVVGLTVREGWPFPIVLLIVLGVGVLTGLINGFLVERLRVNSFIATLGTGGVCAGISAVYSGGTFVGPQPAGPQLPSWFGSFAAFSQKAPSWMIALGVLVAGVTMFFGLDRVRPVSWGRNRWLTTKAVLLVVIAAVLVFVFGLADWISAVSWLIFFLLLTALVIWVLLQHTTFGRHLQAIGSNRSAALLAGVKVQRQVMKSFVLGGTLASVSGIALAASQGTAAPDSAASFLLPAFAAAFLSTVVLSDGRFTVPGTIIGGVFVVWVGLALILGGLHPTWVAVVNGVVLVGAVALSTAMRSHR
ncbi:ABC transporter permease [Geodermatophilus sp. CPCC 205506]|uniref:ABC transporter permease n=1 Tax=Geodermatophilus sp. CPCC 205506 TaxID=2936596 RepID=UPI003EE9469E